VSTAPGGDPRPADEDYRARVLFSLLPSSWLVNIVRDWRATSSGRIPWAFNSRTRQASRAAGPYRRRRACPWRCLPVGARTAGSSRTPKTPVCRGSTTRRRSVSIGSVAFRTIRTTQKRLMDLIWGIGAGRGNKPAALTSGVASPGARLTPIATVQHTSGTAIHRLRRRAAQQHRRSLLPVFGIAPCCSWTTARANPNSRLSFHQRCAR
jgi:hypothetical protein